MILPVRLWAPEGDSIVRLALDTGATYSLISQDILTRLGYHPDLGGARVAITTASGVENVPQITIEKLEALGQQRHGFPVICHNLPASANLDGLLGLDFFRGQRLVVDFRAGTIAVD